MRKQHFYPDADADDALELRGRRRVTRVAFGGYLEQRLPAARHPRRLGWLLALPLCALAADPPAPCGNLPPAMAGIAVAWNEAPLRLSPGDIIAPVGRKLSAQLRPPKELGPPVGRAAPRGREGQGVMLNLNLTAVGEYRVAVSQRAWIEMAEQGTQGRVLAATTSDKRLACAGIAKNLGFDVLSPGPHRLQITEVAAEEVEILVWPAAGIAAGPQQ